MKETSVADEWHALSEGHDKPCHYCGEPCNAMHGNPGLWPLAFCHKNEPGFVKWHHAQCVTDRLLENQKTTNMPYEFYVGGVRFDAGEYVIKRVAPTIEDVDHPF